MGDRTVTATTTFRQYYDARRNRSEFRDLVDEVIDGIYKPEFADDPEDPFWVLKLVSNDQWTFGPKDGEQIEFTADAEGARELAAAYALYALRMKRKKGTPSPFERPTKDGWE